MVVKAIEPENINDANERMWDLQTKIFEFRLTGMEIAFLSDALHLFLAKNSDNISQYMGRRLGRKLFEVVR